MELNYARASQECPERTLRWPTTRSLLCSVMIQAGIEFWSLETVVSLDAAYNDYYRPKTQS